MPEDTVLVGITLLAVIPFVVWDVTSTYRGGFDNSFWQLSLEEKLPKVAEHPAEWRRRAR